jgi:hypothetical protein
MYYLILKMAIKFTNWNGEHPKKANTISSWVYGDERLDDQCESNRLRTTKPKKADDLATQLISLVICANFLKWTPGSVSATNTEAIVSK